MGLTMEKKRVVFLLTYYVLCSMAQLLSSELWGLFGFDQILCTSSSFSYIPFLISFIL